MYPRGYRGQLACGRHDLQPVWKCVCGNKQCTLSQNPAQDDQLLAECFAVQFKGEHSQEKNNINTQHMHSSCGATPQASAFCSKSSLDYFFSERCILMHLSFTSHPSSTLPQPCCSAGMSV